MNWYLAKIVFQVICGNGNHTAQFDEQLRLIEADDEQHAFLKAQQIGVQEEDTFLNASRQLVQWKFVDVCELYLLNQIIDGAEMYSRITEIEDADQYIDIIRRKADVLQGSGILRSLSL